MLPPRFANLIKSPVRSITPVLMRKLELARPLSLRLTDGGTFHGLLPEAVTTNIWRKGLPRLGVSTSIACPMGRFERMTLWLSAIPRSSVTM